jgi:hypothetical protein
LEQTRFQTLDRWRALDSQPRKLHFWLDRAGDEVDFILAEAGKLVALEIKAGRLVTTGDLIGIRAFPYALKHTKGPGSEQCCCTAANQVRWAPTILRCLGDGWLLNYN